MGRKINTTKQYFRINEPRAFNKTLQGLYKIEVTSDPTSRVTQARVFFGNMMAIGSAKCHPNDIWDQDLGEMVAVARATNAMSQLAQETANLRIAAYERAKQWNIPTAVAESLWGDAGQYALEEG